MAVQLQWQRDVLPGGQAAQQVEILEDVADAAPAQLGQRPAAQRPQLTALHQDPPRRRAVQPAGQVQQGRLARAGGTHHGDQFARPDGETHPGQRMHGRGAGAVGPVHVPQVEHLGRRGHRRTS
ncbi:hypothetical protein GCM10027605_19510 [Micromonospora zhanjiangensis]